MNIKLLILLKSVDAGTGTYLEGLLEIKKMFRQKELDIKVLVLESPTYRSKNTDSYSYFSNKGNYSGKYRLSVSSAINFIKEIIWFKKEVLSFVPDIVISSDSHAILISEITKMLFAKEYGSISVLHNNIRRVIEFKSLKYLHVPIKFFLSIFINKSSLVVTVSKALSKNVYNFLALKKLPETVPCMLPSRIQAKRPHPKKSNNVVISVARFDHQKDQETLLKAFQIVLTKIPKAELWLVGSGPLERKMKLVAKKLHILDRVKFLGWIQNPTALLDKSNLFVLSTKWEGFPLTILEAMMRGVPVIASDCDYGPAEIIGNDKYGVLTPVGDDIYLAKSIIRLLKNLNDNKRYALLGYERSKEFSQEIMLSKYKKFIVRVSESKHI